MKESALFYTGRQGQVLRSRQELVGYLQGGKRVYCLMEKRRYRRLDDALKRRMRVVAREGDICCWPRPSNAVSIKGCISCPIWNDFPSSGS